MNSARARTQYDFDSRSALLGSHAGRPKPIRLPGKNAEDVFLSTAKRYRIAHLFLSASGLKLTSQCRRFGQDQGPWPDLGRRLAGPHRQAGAQTEQSALFDKLIAKAILQTL